MGGAFTSIGGVNANNIGMWDGTHWTNIGPGFNDVVISVCSFNGDLYAAGGFSASGANSITNVAKYNPVTHSWSQVGNGLNAFVRALEVHQNELFAGGDFTQSGATPVGHVARLVSGQWTQLSGGGLPGQVTSCRTRSDSRSTSAERSPRRGRLA